MLSLSKHEVANAGVQLFRHRSRLLEVGSRLARLRHLAGNDNQNFTPPARIRACRAGVSGT